MTLTCSARWRGKLPERSLLLLPAERGPLASRVQPARQVQLHPLPCPSANPDSNRTTTVHIASRRELRRSKKSAPAVYAILDGFPATECVHDVGALGRGLQSRIRTKPPPQSRNLSRRAPAERNAFKRSNGMLSLRHMACARKDRSHRLIQSDLSFLVLSNRSGQRISSPPPKALFVCKGIRKMTTHHTQAGGR
jgi:hypothetical protein